MAYKTKKGIELVDGFYLASNQRTNKVSVISIRNSVAYIHNVTRKMTLEDLLKLDSVSYITVFKKL